MNNQILIWQNVIIFNLMISKQHKTILVEHFASEDFSFHLACSYTWLYLYLDLRNTFPLVRIVSLKKQSWKWLNDKHNRKLYDKYLWKMSHMYSNSNRCEICILEKDTKIEFFSLKKNYTVVFLAFNFLWIIINKKHCRM